MTHARGLIAFATLLLLALPLAACKGTPPQAPSAAPAMTEDGVGDTDAESPTTADLRQAHLRLEDREDDVRLTDGAFTVPPPVGQATGGLDLRMLDDPVGNGDLNSDGAPDAVIAVVANTGGSGRFVYLAPYLAGGASPDPIPALFLGDRVNVLHLTIVDGRLTADLVVHGPDDPMCCPSQAERRNFVLTASGALTPAP